LILSFISDYRLGVTNNPVFLPFQNVEDHVKYPFGGVQDHLISAPWDHDNSPPPSGLGAFFALWMAADGHFLNVTTFPIKGLTIGMRFAAGMATFWRLIWQKEEKTNET
jgi:hypothetical protein